MEISRKTEADYDYYQNLLGDFRRPNWEISRAEYPNLTYSDPSTSRTNSIEEANSRMVFDSYNSPSPMINNVNSRIIDNSNDKVDISTMSLNDAFNGLSLKDNQTRPDQGACDSYITTFQNDIYSINGGEGTSNYLHYIDGTMPFSCRVHPYEPELQNKQMRIMQMEKCVRMHRQRQEYLHRSMDPYVDPSFESYMQHSYELPTYLDNSGIQHFPQQIMAKSSRSSLTRPMRFTSSSLLTNQAPHLSKTYLHRRLMSSSSGMMNSLYDSRSVQMRYTTVDEVVGRMYPLAKDQHGCRFLQRKFSDGSLEDKNKIFSELIHHIVELTTDPFGNYLVQKMLEVCNENQRMQIIHALTKDNGTIIEVSCNMHGTRAVQKVIETLKTAEQTYKIISALRHNVVSLMNNINGNHVAQCCLKRFLHEQNDFLINAAIQNCVEIATNRQGCCVLQKCILHSNDDQRNRLMSQISSYAFVLAQDQFGNYLVQFLLDQRIRWVTAAVLNELKGNYAYLSMQKHSSPVVEKCLLFTEEEDTVKIIKEIMAYPRFLHILQDAFGNYVIQKALSQCKGVLHASLVDAIKAHAPALRTHPFGKKVLLSIGSRKYY